MTVAGTLRSGSAPVRRAYHGTAHVHGSPPPLASRLAALNLSTVLIDAASMSWTAARCGPIAVWDAATSRTWVAYLKTGGDLYCTYYDHVAETVAPPVLVAAYPFPTPDFHHAPAVMFDQTGRVHIIWGGHDAGHSTRHYRMTNPRDLTAWTVQTLDDSAYVYGAVAADGELLFTERAGSDHGSTFPAHEFAGLQRSTNGSTWTRTSEVDTTATPEAASDFYQRAAMWAAGRFHILWSVARGATHTTTDWINLYYAAFDPVAGTWHTAAGASLGGSIDWTDHTACLVDTFTDDGTGASLTMHEGNPVVAHWPQSLSNLTVLRWDGSAWQKDSLLTAGAAISRGPRIASTSDGLVMLAHSEDTVYSERTVDVWHLADGRWRRLGTLLEPGVDDSSYHDIMPVYEGPAIAAAQRFVGGTFGDQVDTRTGPLHLIVKG